MGLKETYIAKSRTDNAPSAAPPFPQKLKLDVCNTCNYGCLFCPTAVQSKVPGNIDDALCKKIIKDAYGAGARELAVTSTGEPLLNANLESYIRFAKELGYSYVFINTNGYLLNKARAKSLLASGLDSIKVSFNAGTRETYRLVHGVDGFERVVSNIKLFHSVKGACKLYLSYCIIRQTEPEIPVFKALLADFADDILLYNANSRGGGDIDARLLLGDDDYAFEYPCGQLFKTAVTTAEGYLLVCCQDFDKMTVIADLNQISIANAWNSESFVHFRQRHINRDFCGTICANCLTGSTDVVIPLNGAVAGYPRLNKKTADVQARIQSLIEN